MTTSTILVINGPNLNLLGARDPNQYGAKTLDEINQILQNEFNTLSPSGKIYFFQSNHEGAIIDFIQQERTASGLIINPGALTHYSYALADALRDFPGKKAEVHLSNILERETWRAVCVTRNACDQVFMGKREDSYRDALAWILGQLKASI